MDERLWSLVTEFRSLLDEGLCEELSEGHKEMGVVVNGCLETIKVQMGMLEACIKTQAKAEVPQEERADGPKPKTRGRKRKNNGLKGSENTLDGGGSESLKMDAIRTTLAMNKNNPFIRQQLSKEMESDEYEPTGHSDDDEYSDDVPVASLISGNTRKRKRKGSSQEVEKKQDAPKYSPQTRTTRNRNETQQVSLDDLQKELQLAIKQAAPDSKVQNLQKSITDLVRHDWDSMQQASVRRSEAHSVEQCYFPALAREIVVDEGKAIGKQVARTFGKTTMNLLTRILGIAAKTKIKKKWKKKALREEEMTKLISQLLFHMMDFFYEFLFVLFNTPKEPLLDRKASSLQLFEYVFFGELIDKTSKIHFPLRVKEFVDTVLVSDQASKMLLAMFCSVIWVVGIDTPLTKRKLVASHPIYPNMKIKKKEIAAVFPKFKPHEKSNWATIALLIMKQLKEEKQLKDEPKASAFGIDIPSHGERILKIGAATMCTFNEDFVSEHLKDPEDDNLEQIFAVQARITCHDLVKELLPELQETDNTIQPEKQQLDNNEDDDDAATNLEDDIEDDTMSTANPPTNETTSSALKQEMPSSTSSSSSLYAETSLSLEKANTSFSPNPKGEKIIVMFDSSDEED